MEKLRTVGTKTDLNARKLKVKLLSINILVQYSAQKPAICKHLKTVQSTEASGEPKLTRFHLLL
jgi:hypothetical protein